MRGNAQRMWNIFEYDAEYTKLETALALAEKQLARAEKLNKVMYEALKGSAHILKWVSDNKCECDADVGMSPCEACWHLDLVNNAIAQRDKQSDVLMPDKGGDK